MNIAVVTLNPGVDRIVYLTDKLRPGTMNRTQKAVMNQGSKGANQALMFARLGESPLYYAFTGGQMGQFCESFTDVPGIKTCFVPTEAGVRMNIKVIDGAGGCTEINEKGGPVTASEMANMMEKIKAPLAQKADNYDMLSLCGSIPQGVEKSVYNSLITMANKAGVPTVLDCDGEVLALGLQAKPALIKPNSRELAGLVGESEERVRNVGFLVQACGKIREKFGTAVLCTLDADGSVYVGKEGVFRIGTAPVPLAGFSGAGDTYLSAFVHMYFGQKKPIEQALCFGAAASCAKIALPGTLLPEKEQIDALLPQITVTKIG